MVLSAGKGYGAPGAAAGLNAKAHGCCSMQKFFEQAKRLNLQRWANLEGDAP